MSLHAAVIGVGRIRKVTEKQGFAIGGAHAQGYRDGIPGIELYGVDPNAENLQAFAEKFEVSESNCFASTEALYAARTPDLVSVCTWPTLHARQVLEAASAGVRGIVCEKPMAAEPEEIEAMLHACQECGAKLAIAHQRAYSPGFESVKKLIEDGAIGDQVCMEARVGDGWDMLSWSVHWFDLFGWLFDDEITSVLGGLSHTGQRRYQHAVEDESVVLATTSRGTQGVFVTGPETPHDRAVHLRGRDGMISIEGNEVLLWNREGFQSFKEESSWGSDFALMMADMKQWIQGGKPIRLDANRCAKATLAALSAHESARTMTRVNVAIPSPMRMSALELEQNRPRRLAKLGRVVVVADPHHVGEEPGRSTRDGLMDALAAFDPDSLQLIKVEQEPVVASHLQDADLLVICHTHREAPPQTREAIQTWIEAGHPMLVAHCGIGAYTEWPEFRRWIGRRWVWGDESLPPSGHPHEPCQLTVVSDSGLQTAWDQAWLPKDEVYTELHDEAPVKELVTAEMPNGQVVPAAWRAVDTPNVAVWAPGHRPCIWTLDAMREGLLGVIRLIQTESTP